jgi:hypothetical protein
VKRYRSRGLLYNVSPRDFEELKMMMMTCLMHTMLQSLPELYFLALSSRAVLLCARSRA